MDLEDPVVLGYMYWYWLFFGNDIAENGMNFKTFLSTYILVIL